MDAADCSKTWCLHTRLQSIIAEDSLHKNSLENLESLGVMSAACVLWARLDFGYCPSSSIPKIRQSLSNPNSCEDQRLIWSPHELGSLRDCCIFKHQVTDGIQSLSGCVSYSEQNFVPVCFSCLILFLKYSLYIREVSARVGLRYSDLFRQFPRLISTAIPVQTAGFDKVILSRFCQTMVCAA